MTSLPLTAALLAKDQSAPRLFRRLILRFGRTRFWCIEAVIPSVHNISRL